MISVEATEPPAPVDAILQSTAPENTSINVYFMQSGEIGDGIESNGPRTYEIEQFREAMDLSEAVAEVTFTIVSSPGNADSIYVIDDGPALILS